MNLSKNFNDAVKAILDHCGYTCEDVNYVSIENVSNCQWQIVEQNENFVVINLFENGEFEGQLEYYKNNMFKGDEYTLIESLFYCGDEYFGHFLLLNKNQINLSYFFLC